MLHEFSRSELIIGLEGLEKLQDSKVAVFGVGGVGSFTVEALTRTGVGHLVLIDDDCVCLTNLNRQLHATRKTVGKPKVEAMRDRVLEINPKCDVTIIQKFYMPDVAEEILDSSFDYIVDAIDTVTAKIDLVVRANELGIPIISAMGAGNKTDPTRFQVSDIFKTTVDPLAKVVRKELRNRGIKKLKVVYSTEEPVKPVETETSSCSAGCICPKGTARKCTVKHQIPGSLSFVPSVMGLIIGGEVIKDLIGFNKDSKSI
ncbi:UBA/THIF-type NAD/FAD binding protein [Ruminiclostridium papyrosolvens DSM 2782]|uniref:UBA/THIF-type NAD/FAD binding protein n=1 Tax=Ruminiclostridium papyrosolvens DSM 2782 TaxID=588581 RepID=F1THJ4_9FIRM|nr:tRNA threonylcarbamoyladenosine dehydratase [Ruminiclostridium papyrosolvens]EGD46197.1 UBA/THIF-type NAD/FAD binding protein [Ruminiclostridium papyrosolvens DSM 2782]WES35977.1 tRNA threonylcarbamoyladenosine dehydratase [Ruminiclostridium papyrosolvens DSM 2782]